MKKGVTSPPHTKRCQGSELMSLAIANHEGVTRAGIEFATIPRPVPITFHEVSRLIVAAATEPETFPELGLGNKRQAQLSDCKLVGPLNEGQSGFMNRFHTGRVFSLRRVVLATTESRLPAEYVCSTLLEPDSVSKSAELMVGR